MSTFAYSEDPDEMQHNAAFHQGVHCFKIKKKLLREKNTIVLENYSLAPLQMYNGQSYLNCIYMYGKIHQNTKG